MVVRRAGEGQHAQAGGRQLPRLIQPPVPLAFTQPHHAGSIDPAVAEADDHFRGALADQQPRRSTGAAAEGALQLGAGILDPHRHQLALGAEGNFGGPPVVAAQLEIIDARLESHYREGAFGGIAQDVPAAIGQLLVLGIAAEHAGLQQQGAGTGSAAGAGAGGTVQRAGGHAAVRVVALAAHAHPFGAHPQLLHHLAVLSEGAGFVGADHRHRAQTLHRRQAPDQRGAAHHALGADGEGHRDHSR